MWIYIVNIYRIGIRCKRVPLQLFQLIFGGVGETIKYFSLKTDGKFGFNVIDILKIAIKGNSYLFLTLVFYTRF